MIDFGEKCGLVGVYGKLHTPLEDMFILMSALQHRGQEGAGIAFWRVDGGFERVITLGLVKDLFKDKNIEGVNSASSIIGHIRYSTTGSNDISNVQPFCSKTIDGKTIALAHNGNITNAAEVRLKLMKEGHTFSTTTDSEVILHHIVKEYNRTSDIELSIASAISLFEGAFSILMLFDDKLVAFRDKYGFRPLVFGKFSNGVVFTSEDTALKTIDIFDYEEVKPGEVVIVDQKGIYRKQFVNPSVLSHCVFELVYFSKPSSKVFGEDVYKFRYECGKKLGLYDLSENFDAVVPIPDSGLIAALGYAEVTKNPLVMGLIRNHFTGRSFIQPKQRMRDIEVRTKFFVPSDSIKGKKIVIIDDSIVRGTTMKRIVNLLRKNGVAEVHLRIASPPVKFPCYFGIDFPSKEELIANTKTIEEIQDYIGVESLKYLSLDDMMGILKQQNNFCNSCFSGYYKVKINEVRKDIFEVNYGRI
ncbi:MAG: amidophosphoribosyltransferase [Brevinematia bacterium]